MTSLRAPVVAGGQVKDEAEPGGEATLCRAELALSNMISRGKDKVITA